VKFGDIYIQNMVSFFFILAHQTWTEREIKYLQATFTKSLQEKLYPSGIMLKKAAAHLSGRTVLQIRAKMQHFMKR